MFCFEVRSVLTLFWRAGSVLILKSLGGALLGIDPLLYCRPRLLLTTMNANRGRCDAVSANANSNHKLNFEQTARRLIATNLPDALRCATDIRERVVSSFTI